MKSFYDILMIWACLTAASVVGCSRMENSPVPLSGPIKSAVQTGDGSGLKNIFIKGMIVRRDGLPMVNTKVRFSDDIFEFSTNENGEFSAPLFPMTSRNVALHLDVAGEIVKVEFTLPADIANAINQARVDAGGSAFADAEPPTSSRLKNPPEPPVVAIERRLALQLPDNRLLSAVSGNTAADDKEFLRMQAISLPSSAQSTMKVTMPFTLITNESRNTAARFKWQGSGSSDSSVKVVFAKSEEELSAWNGAFDSLPTWGTTAAGTNVVSDFSKCSDSAYRSQSNGTMSAATAGKCGFNRYQFPFNESGDVFFRFVSESPTELKLSPVFRIASNNTAPTLKALSPVSLQTGSTSVAVTASISDAESQLTCSSALTAVSGNFSLLLNENIRISGTTPDCSLTFFPTSGGFGTSEITVSVNDGSLSSISNFNLNVGGWTQEAFIKASNNDKGDRFGTTLALNGDVLVAASQLEDSNQTTITNGTASNSDNSKPDSGAVYVYRRSGSGWAQEAYIKSVNSGASDYLGWSVAVSGDTLAVGATGEDSSQTTITATPNNLNDDAATGSGAVYVYEKDLNGWAMKFFIKAANADAGDAFGSALALAGNKLLVGAPYEDANETTVKNDGTASADNSATDSGAAYLYERDASNWSLKAFVKAANASSQYRLGSAVALAEDTFAISSTGESSNQTTISNGPTVDNSNSNSTLSGAVYVYRLDTTSGTTWQQEAYIKAANAETNDQFGQSLALSGTGIAVGALNEDSNLNTITNSGTASADNSASDSGAVYIFRRTNSTWALEAFIKAGNSEAGDRFGQVLDLSSETLAVSSVIESSSQNSVTNGTLSSSDNSLVQSGAVYVYRHAGTAWTQDAYIKPSNTGADDQFGVAVNLSGDTLAVGAYREDSNQNTVTNGSAASTDNTADDSGATFIFRNRNRMFSPDVRITGRTNTSISFAWTDSLGGTDFQVKVAPAVQGTASPPVHCPQTEGTLLTAGTATYTYNGLTADTLYGFRFCTWNGSNASEGMSLWGRTLTPTP